MKRLLITLPALLVLACPFDARADDEAEERESIANRIELILREAEELEEVGRNDQADRLRQEAANLEREFGRQQERRQSREEREDIEYNDIANRIEILQREAEELEKVGRADHADRLREEVAELRRHLGRDREHGERPDHLRGGFERLEHAHAAIEHLEAAGMHDLARAAAQHAEAFERELHHAAEEVRGQEERERERHREHPGELAEIHELIGALREEIEQLRAEMRELRE